MNKSVRVWCSKQGYWVVSVPLGSITVTVCVGGAMQPVLSTFGLTGLFSTNKSLPGLGAEVPEMRNWWAGKLGPWLVWNIRSPKVYCSAIAKYGWTSAGFTYLNCGLGGGQFAAPAQKTAIRSAPSILQVPEVESKSHIFVNAECEWSRS